MDSDQKKRANRIADHLTTAASELRRFGCLGEPAAQEVERLATILRRNIGLIVTAGRTTEGQQ